MTSGRSSKSNLFATPEDRHPPAVLSRANELAQSAQREHCSALRELRQNGELREQHLHSLPLPARQKTPRINVPLATAREKIEICDNFDEAAAFLDRQETLAVLNQPRVLEKLLQMPDASLEVR